MPSGLIGRGDRSPLLPLGVLLLLLTCCQAPARAQVAIVRGARLAAAGPAAARNVAAAVARAERCLAAVGVDTTRLEEDRLSPEALAPYRALVLPLNRLEAPDVPIIAGFVLRGGGLIVFAPDGPADFFTLLSLQAPSARSGLRAPGSAPRDPGASSAASMAGIALDPGAPPVAPGLPAWLPLPYRAPRSLAPLDGTHVLGRWAQSAPQPDPIPRAGSGAASNLAPIAVTLGPAGVAVAEPLQDGELLARGWFLRALLARWDPALAAGALPALRRQVTEALDATAREEARARPDGDADRKAEREMRRERARATALLRAPAPPDGDAAALHGALREAQEAVTRLRRLRFGLVPSAPGELRAAWIHTYAPTDWEDVARKLAARGFNALFVRVGRGGNVIYPSALLPRDAWAEGPGDELQRALDAARRHGLAFHAWRVNYDLRHAPRDYVERMAAEDRIVRDPEGRQGISANPADPRNADLELKAMLEIVERYDVDGLQLDYIRYPDVPGYDFDYGAVSRREFERETGRPVKNWPADVLSGPRKREYEEWEIRQVDRLVERVSRAVRQHKPWVQLSAAVWRNHRRYRTIIKQDWPRWVERGWLDFVAPMNYTPEPETFAETIRAQVAAVRGRAPVVAGIGNWLLQTPEELLDQVTAAREAGAAGFILFAYNAEQIDEHLKALSIGATSRPVRPALSAPAARWSLPGALARKDAPLAVAAGKPATIALEVAPGAALPAGLAGEARIERPDGTLLAVLGPVWSRTRSATWRAAAPEGAWRPVVRGVARDGRGRPRNVVAAGPVAEGVSAATLAALRQRDRPHVPSSELDVGIYAGGLGAEGLQAPLAALPGVRVVLFHHLKPDFLAPFEVVILPRLADLADLDDAAARHLRRWTAAGGRLILTHEAVGARWHPRLFPEVGTGGDRQTASVLKTGRAMRLVADVGPLRTGTSFTAGGGDFIPIDPAPGARVLVREAGSGDAVVVAGRWNHGEVILNGMLPGHGFEPLAGVERDLLRALVTRGGIELPVDGRRVSAQEELRLRRTKN